MTASRHGLIFTSRTPSDRFGVNTFNAGVSAGLDHREPKAGRNAGMAPVVNRIPRAAEHFSHSAGATKGGDDRGCVHAPKVSDILTNRKHVFADRVRSSYSAGMTGAASMPPMKRITRDAVAARLRAVRAELGLTPSQLAGRIGVGRTAYANWEAVEPKKPNMPSEEGLASLCDELPGLTLDYLYMGALDTLPVKLAIRLAARELGMEPDGQEVDMAAVMNRLARGRG